VLQIQEGPAPIPRNGEVRIRVEACGVSFVDLMVRMGLLADTPPMPFVPGYEVAGVIDMVGQGVPNLKEGEPVMALTRFGGYSDLICVPHKQVFKRLNWMSAKDGATLPASYLLAYLALVVMGSVTAGDKVLIHSAGGGLGLAVLDLCLILGAETYGTASPHKHDFLLERGLNHAVDYRNFDYERVMMDLTGGRGVQLVVDPFGGVHWPKNYRLLRPTGRLIHVGLGSMVTGSEKSWWSRLRNLIMLPFYTPLKLMRDNKAVIGINLATLWEDADLLRPCMEQIVAWYDEALFRPNIDKQFSFTQVAQAHTYVHERKNVGKVLLIP